MSIVLDVAPTPEDMASHAAAFVVTSLIGSGEHPAICLSGGQTPRALYTCLAADPFRAQMPFARIQWFFGDERFVPRDDPRNNAGMANEQLFRQASIPGINIHPMQTVDCTLDEAARSYEAELASFYGANVLAPDRPLFDLVLLGLGEDGHTASLFPGSQQLKVKDRWVAPVATSDPARLTLTLPALASARHLAFLVSGESKRGILKKMLAGDPTIPATQVRPAGAVHIFADVSAAP